MTAENKPTRFAIVRYYVDYYLSKGPSARFIGLFLISAGLVSICSLLILLVSPSESSTSKDFFEALWWATMRVADAGTMSDDTGALVRLVAGAATLSGIIVVALLIGLVSDTVGEKLDDLRKGKTPVIDSNHTLIIGFSDKVFTIINELIVANGNQKNPSIVILSETEKTTVEEALRERIPDSGNTRIVVRQGSAFLPADLRKVGADRAKSIIVLAADLGDQSSNSDLNAIKTILALRQIPGALERNHAVVELEDIDQAAVVAKLGNVEVVAMRDTLARLMVQTARQSGLASVYRNILNFEGAEFYIKGFSETAGKKFGDLQHQVRGCTLIGLRRIENSKPTIQLNPGSGTIVKDDDELIVLAEDDDSFSIDLDRKHLGSTNQRQPFFPKKKVNERILICGFRTDLDRIIGYLDSYLKPGAEIHIMPGKPFDVFDIQTGIVNASLVHLKKDPGKLQDVRDVIAEGYDSVLLVADDSIPFSETDARTVITLLMLRNAFGESPGKHVPRIISEILDPRTKDLISTDDTTDFVVSSEITSMLIAQVSEQRDLNKFYQELFDPEGSEIYLKSVERFAQVGSPLSWHHVQVAAAHCNEIAIGCFRPGSRPFINPDPDTMLTFAVGDKIIVIAEDESEAVEHVKSA